MRFICFGDSNTYGYDNRSYFGGRYDENTRWPRLLAQMSGGEAVELGENGRRIPRTEAEIQNALGSLRRAGPADFLIVLLGGNDLLSDGAEASAETAAARMERFRRRTDELPELRSAKKVLAAPPPFTRGAWVSSERLISESRRLAKSYERLAGRLGCAFLNSGELPLQSDGVHFTEEAHRLLSEKLLPLLKR